MDLERERYDPELRRVTTDRVSSRARRCRHTSFAPTVPFFATARGLASLRKLPPSDLGAAEAEFTLSANAERPGAPSSGHRSRPEPRAPLPPSQFRAYFILPRHRTRPVPHNEGCRRATPQVRRSPALKMRCARRSPSSFLATVRGIASRRELPPRDPAGRGLASLRELPLF